MVGNMLREHNKRNRNISHRYGTYICSRYFAEAAEGRQKGKIRYAEKGGNADSVRHKSGNG